nr:DUF1616 domain-containing protein [Halobaculum sp. YSMS11]
MLLPAPVRELPADLAVVIVAVLATAGSVFIPGVNQTPLRVVFGLAFVLFVPGYALISALFPEAGELPEEDADTDSGERAPAGIDGIERVALSFGTSIAIVPLIGLVLNFTPFGIRLAPIVISVGGITLLFVAVAAQRRRALPASEQFQVPYETWLADARVELLEPDTRTDAALNVLLAVSVIIAVSAVGYAVAVPQQGESFTEFYLLTEGDDGELVADDYPTEYTRGETGSLVVGVTNQEHESAQYTVLVQLQRVEVANNSTTVLEESRLNRWQVQLAHNETWRLQHSVTPEMSGDRLRLAYLLYKGSPPAEPTVDNAYRELHLWINVSDSSASLASELPSAAPHSR